MPSLKDLKNRITSVKSTRKITKAMQMVAAAKLKRAQDAATASRPYASRMATVLANLSASAGAGGPKLLAGTGEDKTHLLVVMTAERGLAGGFNTYVVKLAKQKIGELRAEGKTVKILTVGKKGREQLSREYGDMFISHVDLADVKGGDYTDSALGLGHTLTKQFEDGEFDVATLIYSQFKNVLSQVPTAQQIIPASAPVDAPKVDLKGAIYQYEPSEIEILETLLPRYINTQILSAMLESAAGEQASRMTAMDNATRNAGDMIDSLSLQYNRARQAQITKELIEIISGAEAL
ncbi:MAG: F0F1 ATP synthase subunit gamma [Alphaproteobacteria bacterium]|uniref:F0F1 ATP synthase subunit gamma n=1 Tax=Hyphomonas sp. TaxID=87 RepID=UPI001DCB79F5|nr:F0F1 ATP synthase subunit gamma [Alphaproteobacteria bacterium]MBU2083442.1 F0F1 ATP synthase subunit gamma [Alphaproteobacteria bacterium]MBU2143592.1 F0F1 ATP synthase subunit gamma [Alphaproteobacteria bacterium]MBU2196007.1 F0F1 ATP synthase subunit gamma [Alphaproteobacteria bacterium]